jgi:membrane protein DedA with SNARE-associated domain
LPFLAFSLAGTVIWNTLLTWLGYALGSQYDLVSTYVNPVSNVVVAVLVLTYIYRVIRKKGGIARDATG